MIIIQITGKSNIEIQKLEKITTISGGNKIMTRNSKNEYSKNEYSKNEYSKNGYEKSEYSKNQKNSRDCNHVKDREMSSYGQQNREQDEKDEYEKY